MWFQSSSRNAIQICDTMGYVGGIISDTQIVVIRWDEISRVLFMRNMIYVYSEPSSPIPANPEDRIFPCAVCFLHLENTGFKNTWRPLILGTLSARDSELLNHTYYVTTLERLIILCPQQYLQDEFLCLT